jgi:hypothetical protein
MAGFNANRAAPGITRGIRALLNDGNTTAADQLVPYKQANELSKGVGLELENDMARAIQDKIMNPREINNAASYAANVNPEKVAEYEFNRNFMGDAATMLDKYDKTPGGAGETTGLTPEQTAAINQFKVNHYGSQVNEKGAADYSKGLGEQFKTGIAKQLAEATNDPNAAISYAEGKPYTPFKVDGDVVLDTGTGALGPTTELGKAAIALDQAKVGTEGAKQGTEKAQARKYDSQHGFPSERSGGTDSAGKPLKITVDSSYQSSLGTPAVDEQGNPMIDPFSGKQIINRNVVEEENFLKFMNKGKFKSSDAALVEYVAQGRPKIAGNTGTTAPAAKPKFKVNAKANQADVAEYQKRFRAAQGNPAMQKKINDFALSKGIIQ